MREGRYEFREHPPKIRCQQHRVVGSRPRAEATDGGEVEAGTIALNGGTIMVARRMLGWSTVRWRPARPTRWTACARRW